MSWKEIFRKKKDTSKPNVIKLALHNIRDCNLKSINPKPDAYLDKLSVYLEFALECGMDGEFILRSCIDLVDTLDPFFRAEDTIVKTSFWNQEKSEFLLNTRPSRTVTMQLYPEYFSAILSGIKRYEGRAYDPFSPKKYADFRCGDRIVFNINQETGGWQGECEKFGLKPDMLMEVEMGEVNFSPTVHGMYQFCSCLGEEFQPMIQGYSELLQLQRAAVYYSFPGYIQRIKQYGFLGIEMVKPRLINCV